MHAAAPTINPLGRACRPALRTAPAAPPWPPSLPLRRKNSEFFEDPDIEPRFRSKLADYRGSGFDRGHMAPASNHKASQQTMNDTFCLSNMSPQVSGCRHPWWVGGWMGAWMAVKGSYTIPGGDKP